MTRENTELAGDEMDAERAAQIVKGLRARCVRESKTEAHTLAIRHLRAMEVKALDIMLSAAPPPSVEVERLRDGLEEIVCWYGEAPHTFPDWKTTASALSEMAQNVLDGHPALSSPESRAALSRKQEPGVPTPGVWIEWSGGPNPVPGQMVDTRFRGFTIAEQYNDPSEWWTWMHNDTSFDIIAYRIVPTPGGEGK